jgi:hypothetical protein
VRVKERRKREAPGAPIRRGERVDAVEANLSGLSEAAEGLDYVQAVILDLDSVESELRALMRMEWRSDAAEECAEYLHECVRRVEQTVGEYQAAADLLADYATEIRAEAGAQP